MHIILMLFGVIIGLSVMANFHWLLGAPIVIGSLFFFEMGSKAWRHEQENFLLFVGLCCGAFTLLYNIFS